MKFTRRAVLCAHVAPGLLGLQFEVRAQLPSVTTHSPERVPPNQLHALLVGVSACPGLPALPPLQGVAADVRDMKSLALALGVPPGNLRVLCDAEPSSLAPTLAHIDRALTDLVDAMQAGHHVLIYLSGHGAQQPVSDDEVGSGPESDHLDEVFLAADAHQFDISTRSIPGGLTDNRIGQALQALTSKGAHVWLLVDSCHAGTMSRGSLDESDTFVPVAWRGASPQQIGLDVLDARWRNMLSRGAQTARGRWRALSRRRGSLMSVPAALPRVTAFYATDQSGMAMEVRRKGPAAPASLASSAPANLVRGLFTGVLVEEALRILALPGGASVLNYRLLMQRVVGRYRAQAPRDAPMPMFEGVDANAWFGLRKVGGAS